MLNKLFKNDTQRMVAIAIMVAVVMYMLLGSNKECAGCGGKSHYKANMRRPVRERYILKPTMIGTTGQAPEGGLRSLPYKKECTPGMETGAYYTKDLTPGGLCGDQEYVNAAMHKYSIDSGIGGSLLDN